MFDIRNKRKRVVLQLILLLMTIPYAVPLIQMVLGSLGGIGLGNLADVLAHGINVVVAGTAVFGAPDPAAVIAEMRKMA